MHDAVLHSAAARMTTASVQVLLFGGVEVRLHDGSPVHTAERAADGGQGLAHERRELAAWLDLARPQGQGERRAGRAPCGRAQRRGHGDSVAVEPATSTSRASRRPSPWEHPKRSSRPRPSIADALVGLQRAAVTLPAATGVGRAVVVPSPSRPLPFDPQHITVLSARSAHVCELPAATATASVSPETWMGDVSNSPIPLTPLPSWPEAFEPQHCTVPSSFTTQVWSPVAAEAIREPGCRPPVSPAGLAWTSPGPVARFATAANANPMMIALHRGTMSDHPDDRAPRHRVRPALLRPLACRLRHRWLRHPAVIAGTSRLSQGDRQGIVKTQV